MAYFPLTRPQKYDSSAPLSTSAIEGEANLSKYGQPANQVGLQSLYKMLQGEGRVDPRLLAVAQAQNSRSTQQQQDAARADAARRGFGGGGLNQALQAAIASAGATRSANLNYQDIADSYGRQQQNFQSLKGLVTDPTLGYASLSSDLFKTKSETDAQTKAARLGVIGSVFQGIGGMFGGCWVAESLFGSDAYETHMARFYVNNLASDELRDAYMVNGQDLAEAVATTPEMQDVLRPHFMSFVKASELVLR